MTCEICSTKEAVFHIKQIIGKDEIELHLCEKCARLRGITKNEDTIDFSISQLLTGLVDTKSLPKKSGNEIAECPTCGFTVTKFKNSVNWGAASASSPSPNRSGIFSIKCTPRCNIRANCRVK